jgi:hypothetical protein
MQKLVILFDHFQITIVQAIRFTISASQHEKKNRRLEFSFCDLYFWQLFSISNIFSIYLHKLKRKIMINPKLPDIGKNWDRRRKCICLMSHTLNFNWWQKFGDYSFAICFNFIYSFFVYLRDYYVNSSVFVSFCFGLYWYFRIMWKYVWRKFRDKIRRKDVKCIIIQSD